MAYFEGRHCLGRSGGKAARPRHPPSAHQGRAAFQASGQSSFVMKHLNKLHDRAELIECWIGLGLILSVFLLALLLLPL
jgi:hypothetical protein